MRKSKIVFIDLQKTLLKLFITLLAISLYFTYQWWNKPFLVHLESSELSSSYQVHDPGYIKNLAFLLDNSDISGASKPIKGTFKITISSRRKSRTFTFDNPLLVYDQEGKKYILPGEALQRELHNIISALKERSPYGDLIPWDRANQLFPYNTTVVVRDLDTGKTFHVIRRSGYSLARVSPSTPEDKETIKGIFEGKWSWKRRAIVVYLGKKRAAACLTGMPQGKEGLFSICFFDNNLNKSLNFANKLVIYKAAGRLKSLFRNSSPEESILGALTTIDQKDGITLNFFLTKPVDNDLIKKSGLIGLTLRNLTTVEKGENYKALVSVSFGTGPYNHWRSIHLRLKFNRSLGFYQLDPAFLQQLLQR